MHISTKVRSTEVCISAEAGNGAVESEVGARRFEDGVRHRCGNCCAELESRMGDQLGC